MHTSSDAHRKPGNTKCTVTELNAKFSLKNTIYQILLPDQNVTDTKFLSASKNTTKTINDTV